MDALDGIANNLELLTTTIDEQDDRTDLQLLDFTISQYSSQINSREMSIALINRFGTLGGIISATYGDLYSVSGLTKTVATMLKGINTFRTRISHAQLYIRPIINNGEALKDYLLVHFRHLAIEQFLVVYLDNGFSLIKVEVHTSGTVDHVAVYPREIVKRALQLGATRIVIAHNHPSGIKDPSRLDLEMTRRLIAACRLFDIEVYDHIIVARDNYTSFRNLSLM